MRLNLSENKMHKNCIFWKNPCTSSKILTIQQTSLNDFSSYDKLQNVNSIQWAFIPSRFIGRLITFYLSCAHRVHSDCNSIQNFTVRQFFGGRLFLTLSEENKFELGLSFRLANILGLSFREDDPSVSYTLFIFRHWTVAR